MVNNDIMPPSYHNTDSLVDVDVDTELSWWTKAWSFSIHRHTHTQAHTQSIFLGVTRSALKADLINSACTVGQMVRESLPQRFSSLSVFLETLLIYGPFYFQFPAFSCAALNAWQQWKCEANALCTCTMMKLQATRGSNEQKQIILKTLQPTSAFLLQHTFNMNVTVIKKSKYNYWAVWRPLYWETTKNPMSSIPWESLFSWPWCQAFRLITVDKMGIKAVCNYLCSPMGNGNILRELRSYFAYNWLQGYITRCSELPLFFSAPFLLRKYIIVYKMCHLQHEEVLHVIFIDTSNLESEFLPQWHT